MRTSDFHYDLPSESIASHPPSERGDSRLLYLPKGDVPPFDCHFSALPTLLRAGDLLVLNDTRVLPARLYAKKETGGQVDLLFEGAMDHRHMHVRARRPPAVGGVIRVDGVVPLTVLGRQAGQLVLRIDAPDYTVSRLLATHGQVPLPPYLRRLPDADDVLRYQTIYARHSGSVAAPTAGLHVTAHLLRALLTRGISCCFVTLHIGSATFQPLRVENVAAHSMHREFVVVSPDTVAAVRATRARKGRVVAVGTTVVRALETAACRGRLCPFTGKTDIFIYPGFEFRVVDAMVTNFHLPRSTLLLLVSAFAGTDRLLSAYAYAVAHGYRFYSYGDAMLLEHHAL